MNAMDDEARSVLDFWFGAPDASDYGQPREAWFRKDDAFDAAIRMRFAADRKSVV